MLVSVPQHTAAIMVGAIRVGSRCILEQEVRESTVRFSCSLISSIMRIAFLSRITRLIFGNGNYYFHLRVGTSSHFGATLSVLTPTATN